MPDEKQPGCDQPAQSSADKFVTPDSALSLRMLEHWLPLAQQENRSQQWGYDAASLEALILAAMPALQQVQHVLAARYVLWQTHRQRAVDSG
jgi:hypothetical protein